MVAPSPDGSGKRNPFEADPHASHASWPVSDGNEIAEPAWTMLTKVRNNQ